MREVRDVSQSTRTTPWDRADMLSTPRPLVVFSVELAIGRRTEKVSVSLLPEQGQSDSGRRPHGPKVATNWSQEESDPGGFGPENLRKLTRIRPVGHEQQTE